MNEKKKLLEVLIEVVDDIQRLLHRQVLRTRKDIEQADPLTIFEGLEGECYTECAPQSWWSLYLTDSGWDRVTVYGVRVVQHVDGSLLSPQPDEDAPSFFDEIDAALCYLNEGGRLMKLPNKNGGFALFVIEPVPDWFIHEHVSPSSGGEDSVH